MPNAEISSSSSSSGATGTAGADRASSAPAGQEAQDAPPAWFEAAMKKLIDPLKGEVEGFKKFTNGELEKLRRSGRATAGTAEEASKDNKGTTGGASSPAALTRDDLAAARRIGQLMTGLPADVAAEIEQLEADGASYGEIERTLKLLHKGLAGATSATSKTDATSVVPPGKAATAANQTSPTHPKSMKEYLALQKRANAGDKVAKQRIEQLVADDTFALDELE